MSFDGHFYTLDILSKEKLSQIPPSSVVIVDGGITDESYQEKIALIPPVYAITIRKISLALLKSLHEKKIRRLWLEDPLPLEIINAFGKLENIVVIANDSSINIEEFSNCGMHINNFTSPEIIERIFKNRKISYLELAADLKQESRSLINRLQASDLRKKNVTDLKEEANRQVLARKEQLEQQAKNLMAENSTLKDENKNLQARNEYLQLQEIMLIDQISEQENKVSETLETTETRVKGFEKEVVRLKQALASSQVTEQMLRDNLTLSAVKATDMQAKLALSEQSIQQRTNASAVYIKSLEEKISGLSKQLTEAQQRCQSLQLQSAALANEHQQQQSLMQRQLLVTLVEAATQKNALQAALPRIQTLESQLAGKVNELNQMKRKYEEENQSSYNLAMSLNNTLKHLSEHETKEKNLNQQTQLLKEQLQKKVNELGDNDKELQTAKRKITELEKKVQSLENQEIFLSRESSANNFFRQPNTAITQPEGAGKEKESSTEGPSAAKRARNNNHIAKGPL